MSPFTINNELVLQVKYVTINLSSHVRKLNAKSNKEKKQTDQNKIATNKKRQMILKLKSSHVKMITNSETQVRCKSSRGAFKGFSLHERERAMGYAGKIPHLPMLPMITKFIYYRQ